MNAGWVVPVLLLSLACALLLWRVWRLEESHRQIGRLWSAIEQEALWRTSADDQRAPWSAHSALSTQVTHLARALGYEWKRTDAKEGWERSAVASVKPDAPKNPFGFMDMHAYHKAVDAYVNPCRPVGMDRRKADRRKPVEPKKKPRRAH